MSETVTISEASANCKKKYNEDTGLKIQGSYLILAIVWIVLIFVLGIIEKADYIIYILLLIPILVFFIGFYNAPYLTYTDENETLLSTNYLAFGTLVAIVLINWNTPIENSNKHEFFKLFVVGFILIMLAMINVWVKRKTRTIVKHIRTGIEAMALVILAIALYGYFKTMAPV